MCFAQGKTADLGQQFMTILTLHERIVVIGRNSEFPQYIAVFEFESSQIQAGCVVGRSA
jgi:hypothetical protein